MANPIVGISDYGRADAKTPKILKLHITGIHGWEDLDTEDPLDTEDLWIGLSRSAVGTYFKPDGRYELSVRTAHPGRYRIPVAVTMGKERGYLFSAGADLRGMDSARYGLEVLRHRKNARRDAPLYTGDLYVQGGVPEIVGITPKLVSGENTVLISLRVRNAGQCRGCLLTHEGEETVSLERCFLGARQHGTHQEFIFDSQGLARGRYTVQYHNSDDIVSGNVVFLSVK